MGVSLDTTTKSLEVVLSATVTTNQLPFVAGYVDISQANLVLTAVQESDGTTNNTTAVTLLSAPAASTSRQLKYLSIYNADTVSATVTVRVNNNSTTRTTWKGTLAAGDVLLFDDGRGFYVLDSAGNLKVLSVGAAHPLLDGSIDSDTVAGTVARGDLIVGNSTPKWARFGIGSANVVLRSNGTDPSWAQVALATDVSGTLPVANGGTGASTLTANNVLLGNGTSALQAVAPGTSGNLLTSNGTTWASAAAPSTGSMTLLKAGSGTSTAAGNTNVDSYSFASNLTALDTVQIYYTIESVTQQTALPGLFGAASVLVYLGAANPSANLPAGGTVIGEVFLRQPQSSATAIWAHRTCSDMTTTVQLGTIQGGVSGAWQGAWTLNLNHNGVTAGGTFKWSWAVYKIAGQ